MQNKFMCEVCDGMVCKEFTYPTNWEARLAIERSKLTLFRVIRNNCVFFAKLLISCSPTLGISRLEALHARAKYRQWSSRKYLVKLHRNLQYGAALFKNKKIRICQDCGFGSIFPSISEQSLRDYYAKLYWLALAKTLEPEKNKRTIAIYEFVKNYIPFECIRNTIEFGSASAQLSRYFKRLQPHLEINVIEAGENWSKLLRRHVTSIFKDIRV